MNKKRILICDDEDDQYRRLERLLGDAYSVIRSTSYLTAADDISRHWPIHLLILDLGFPKGQYVGHECLEEVTRRFPSLRVIIHSDLASDVREQAKGFEVARKLVGYTQVKSFLGTSDKPWRVLFEVERAIGTSDWLKRANSEVWILHVSDLQFGGAGLPHEPETLAERVDSAILKFVNDPAALPEEGRSRPGLVFATGDLTQRGRPEEFELARRFLEQIKAQVVGPDNPLIGVVPDPCLAIPGNHDISWDVSRAQNIHEVDRHCEYQPAPNARRTELQFIGGLAWEPYASLRTGTPAADSRWWSGPGFAVVDLKNELRLIIAVVNSSLWGVFHCSESPYVKERSWLELKSALDAIDRQRDATRILLVHHPVRESGRDQDRLWFSQEGPAYEELVGVLKGSCGIDIGFSGHLHKEGAYWPRGREKTPLWIVAGTLRSDDRADLRRPHFNLVRLHQLDPGTNRYGSATVYAFEWRGSDFGFANCFDDGTTYHEGFRLIR